MGEPLKVMEYDGKSYVQLSHYYSQPKRDYRINGAEPVLGKGDGKWAVVEGPVTSIESRKSENGKVIRFDRIEGAPAHLPETLPVESFVMEGYERKCTEGYDACYFTPVREPDREWWEPLEFEVIDRNCYPVQMEPWAKVNWPANVERYAEQQHKYPCYIEAKSLFSLVAEAVKAKIDESDGALTWNEYLNIGTFTVKRVVLIPAEMQKPMRREVIRLGSRSRRPKYETVTHRKEERELFTYNGFYRRDESCRQNEIRTPQLQGKDYADHDSGWLFSC